jgi:hypothetical protein
MKRYELANLVTSIVHARNEKIIECFCPSVIKHLSGIIYDRFAKIKKKKRQAAGSIIIASS